MGSERVEKKYLLLVDDNEDDIDLTLMALQKNKIANEIVVVILTSSSEQRDVLEGYNLGANSYIRKPVDFNKFSNAVRQMGLYWLAVNEPPEFIT
ncbi:MAG: response regulator [Balneolaceae bacterium]|nr:MAG: response regulator [Balneolaceae bacterium]